MEYFYTLYLTLYGAFNMERKRKGWAILPSKNSSPFLPYLSSQVKAVEKKRLPQKFFWPDVITTLLEKFHQGKDLLS